MFYRVAVAAMFAAAMLLTLNEWHHEQRARGYAAQIGQPPAGAARGSASPASSGWSAYPAPDVLPPPPVAPARQQSPAAYLAPGQTLPPTPPFLAYRAKVKSDVDLLTSPTPFASPAEPLSHLPAGIVVEVTAEEGGWLRVESSLARGWAPAEFFEIP